MATGSGRTAAERLDTILEGGGDDDGLTKREKMLQLISKKKQCDKKAQEIVYALIETNVEENYLLENAGLISPNHWEDIVEERKITKICGWVLCDNELGDLPKKQYSIRGNQVYDITERKSYCSSHCYAVSIHFKKQLLVSPLWLRDEEEIPEFEILQKPEKELCGISLNFNKLNIDDDEEHEIEESDNDGNHDSDTEDNKCMKTPEATYSAI